MTKLEEATHQAPFVTFNFRDGEYRCSAPGDQSGRWVSWDHFARFMSKAISLAYDGKVGELENFVNEQYKVWGGTIEESKASAPQFVVVRAEKCKWCEDGTNPDRCPEVRLRCVMCRGTGQQRTEVPLLEALRALGVIA